MRRNIELRDGIRHMIRGNHLDSHDGLELIYEILYIMNNSDAKKTVHHLFMDMFPEYRFNFDEKYTEEIQRNMMMVQKIKMEIAEKERSFEYIRLKKGLMDGTIAKVERIIKETDFLSKEDVEI